MAKPSKYPYYDKVTVFCTNGGFQYVLGMTLPELTVEICGRSHPFYTGKEVLVDSGGRLEKFNRRLAKANQANPATVNKTDTKAKTRKPRKAKLTLAQLT
jgi:ribosomal protein L31